MIVRIYKALFNSLLMMKVILLLLAFLCSAEFQQYYAQQKPPGITFSRPKPNFELDVPDGLWYNDNWAGGAQLLKRGSEIIG